MIRLYDFELSGSCYKVRLLLNILKVSCERIPVDFLGKEHKTERFLKLSPLGELPVLEDGDVRLRDAQSILVYIARQYDRSNTWFPDAPDSMGRIMQWLSFGGNELMAASGARLVRMLNSASLTRSAVGRTRSESGAASRRPRASPAITRTWPVPGRQRVCRRSPWRGRR